MKIKNVQFIKSLTSLEDKPEPYYPEVCLAGRSNVGKSSLINKMLNRKAIAKISSKPGKTRTLNYFEINNSFYFVDVPGYGYASASKSEKEKWGIFLESYFRECEQLMCAVLLIDSRHKPTSHDKMMYDFFNYHQIPLIVVATKIDKLGTTKVATHIKQIKNELNYPGVIIPFSSETGKGVNELWQTIGLYINLQDEQTEN